MEVEKRRKQNMSDSKSREVSSTRNITITEHSVDNYIDRILNVDPEEQGSSVRDWCRAEILKVVLHPEEIKHNKQDMPQIHIKDGIAVPVGRKVGNYYEEDLKPYNDLDNDDIIVPTCYRSDEFKNDNDA